MLNLNYTLLSEGMNSKYRTTDYYMRTSSLYPTYSNGYLLTQISNFNQIIREATIELDNIHCTDEYYINESTIIEKVINGGKFIIDKVINAVKKIADVIIGFFKQIISFMKSKFKNNKSDKVESKYRETDRVKILRQALYNSSQEETTVFIADINPTADLLNKNFPDTSIIGSDLVKMTTDALDSYIYNHKSNQVIDGSNSINNAEASESLANYLENQKEAILLKMFGKYSYNSEDPINSVRVVAEKAYGSNDQKDTRLTVDLYLLACDNLTRSNEVIKDIENNISVVDKSYKEIKNALEKASKELQNSKNIEGYTGSTIKDDYDKYTISNNYRNNVNRLMQNINRILNVVQKTVYANYNLLSYKRDRINQLFNPENGDSARVKRAAHRLIMKQLGMEEDISESYYNPSDDMAEAKALESQFESSLCMIEEYWLENEYNANVMKYLTEAGEGQNTTPTNGTTNPASAQNAGNQQQLKMDSVQTTLNNSVKNISEFARKQSEKFNQLFDKFKETIIKGSIMTDTPFWNRNKGKIKDLGGEIAKTNVADWYEYDINRFKTKIDIKFDANAPYLNSDQEFQEAIFQKFNYTAAKFTREDANKTFSQKMLRVFYRSYIDKDKYTALGSTDYNHDLSFGFVDDIVKNQFNGEYLNTLRENRKLLNENIKTAENTKANINNTETQNVESKTTVKVNTTGTPVADGGTTAKVDEAALDKDDFRFNLAEHFGLVSPERIIPIYELQTQVADTARQAPDEGTKTPEQQLQAKINRYCKYMTFAISAMMTSELKAYKQYMGLYKDHFKKPRANNNQQQQNQTVQQQNQEQK